MGKAIVGTAISTTNSWTGSWTGAPDNPSAVSAVSAMIRVVCAASAHGVRGHTSHNPPVVGSSPTRPTRDRRADPDAPRYMPEPTCSPAGRSGSARHARPSGPQIELGKLLAMAQAGRQPDSDVTVAQLLDQYVSTAAWDVSTRESNLGYIRRTIKRALGSTQVRKVRGFRGILHPLIQHRQRPVNLIALGRPSAPGRSLGRPSLPAGRAAHVGEARRAVFVRDLGSVGREADGVIPAIPRRLGAALVGSAAGDRPLGMIRLAGGCSLRKCSRKLRSPPHLRELTGR